MSLGPSKTSSVGYTGNGTQTSFPTKFPFLEPNDLIVTVGGTIKTLTTDYTITGGLGGLGTVTFGTAPTNALAIVIKSVYSADTTNAMIRRWNDLGNPIDGPLARESQSIPAASQTATVGAGHVVIANQVNQKRIVSEKQSPLVGVAETGGTSIPLNSIA